MKKLILTIGFCLTLSGCSVYYAANAPAPVEYKKVQVGTDKNEVLSILGVPKVTDNKGNQKTETFEFVDGYSSASKARILLYLAGDVFTASLAEVIFWPLETAALKGDLCRGTVSYDNNDHVIGYDIMDSKGSHLWTSAPTTK
jgi:hypothetical protein